MKPASADLRNERTCPSLESLRESPSIGADVAFKGSPPRARVGYPGLIEFFLLLALGMLGWFLCSPVLPIPAGKHLPPLPIALAGRLFLAGVGRLAARPPGFCPRALPR